MPLLNLHRITTSSLSRKLTSCLVVPIKQNAFQNHYRYLCYSSSLLSFLLHASRNYKFISNSSHYSSRKVLTEKYYNTVTGLAKSSPTMTNDSAPASEAKVFSRLLKTVIPSHYKLTLKPDLNKLIFEGSQEIDVETNAETSEIMMNAVDLTITNVELLDPISGTKAIPSEVVLNTKDETLNLKFSSLLPSGQGKLKISFTGVLNDQLKGFYRSSYKGLNGNEKFNAVTQFAPTDARRCFPNWDEPAVKATFDLKLIVPKDLVAVSNMCVKSTKSYESDQNLQVVEYETTPIMSTYLLAFAIGEFDYIETTSTDGVLCRVYTPPGKKEQGRFALEVVSKALPYYRDYFGIAYPLPKIDLIAVADFLYGAMENWGLVAYRENLLLVDAQESSASTKQRVALTVAHEIAHQWFGNLVTMEWWTHLWLNEGYASFVEFMCVDHLFPDWDMWTQFVTDTHIRALELDCLKNSHPIEVPVNHPKEIEEIFDAISYSKGASVIRMLYNFIGDDAFRRGMNLYLTRHKYGNTFTEDLWRALAETSSKPVEEVMTTWTKQMGFPLIRVTESVQDGTQRRLTLTQEKFTADPQSEVGSQSWLVPLAFSTGGNPGKVTQEALMTEKSLSVTVNDVASDQWVKVNPGTVGFYRVLYPSELLSKFIPSIKSRSLPLLDRLGLLDDVFALVQAGKAPVIDVLKLMEAYVDETDYTCWTSLTNIAGKLSLLLAYSDTHDAFKAYGRSIFGTISESAGWDVKPHEGHLVSMLRSVILDRMVSLEDEATLKEANRRFVLHVSGEDTIIADLRTAVYKGTLSTGDEKTFDSIMKLYLDATTQEEKVRIARSMGSIKDKNLLQKVLEFAISGDVRKQDTVIVISAVSLSKDGRELAWNYFKDNVQKFKEEYPSQLISSAIKRIVENFVTEEKAIEIEQFFHNYPYPGTERSVQQAIESIRLNKEWLGRNLKDVKGFFEAYNSNSK